MDTNTNTVGVASPPSHVSAPADGALAERNRCERLLTAGRTLNLQAEAERMIQAGVPASEGVEALLDHASARQAATACVRSGGDSSDDPDFKARQCIDALTHRLSGGRIALPDSAQSVRSMGIMEMHRYASGALRPERSRTWLTRADIGGAHTTSDYPVLLLESAANRTLAEAFMVAASPLRQIARVITVQDFRQITRARRGEAPKLLEVREHGEVEHGTVGEEFERYVVKTYARNFALTRNAIINDDLNAFADFLADMGRSAAITEAGVLVSLIMGNGVTLSDGTSLWHVNHGNLSATSDALAPDKLGAARAAMRLQKSPTNQEPLNLVPRFLLVSAGRETAAEQVLAEIAAASVQDVNVFSGKLQLLVEPRLDATVPNAWYVFSDPGSMPFLEIATLDGSRPMATAGAPQLRTFEGEDVLGIKMQAVHDFGAWPVNFRAGYKNSGA